jgi:hypothetical protein
VRHWWLVRKQFKKWVGKILVNGVGLVLTAFILVSVSIIKFYEGGWITIFITGSLVTVAVVIRRSYKKSLIPLKRLDSLVETANIIGSKNIQKDIGAPTLDPKAKTAVILVSGYNGLGLHTLFYVTRLFGDTFKNFFFVQAGVIDAGNFKGEEIEKLEKHVNDELDCYVTLMRAHGYYAEGFSSVGTDAVEETCSVAYKIIEQYPQAVFFGGQMIFPQDTFFSKLLHNYTTFAVQKRFYRQGIPFLIMPIRVGLGA